MKLLQTINKWLERECARLERECARDERTRRLMSQRNRASYRANERIIANNANTLSTIIRHVLK